LLSDYCVERKFPFAEIPEQLLDGIRVSSTYIRRQIETGDMATAVRFLGHPHILTGTVIPGKQLGRTLGIPTANLQLPENLVVPRFGVYACRVQIDGIQYPAVTNIGIRPTVSGSGITVEPWILDYSGDLYGRQITLEFFHFLRPERKFPSLEALKAEIHANAQQSRELLKTYKNM
jgi:riboflavin kinase/FMN adenylyltransferase